MTDARLIVKRSKFDFQEEVQALSPSSPLQFDQVVLQSIFSDDTSNGLGVEGKFLWTKYRTLGYRTAGGVPQGSVLGPRLGCVSTCVGAGVSDIVLLLSSHRSSLYRCSGIAVVIQCLGAFTGTVEH